MWKAHAHVLHGRPEQIKNSPAVSYCPASQALKGLNLSSQKKEYN